MLRILKQYRELEEICTTDDFFKQFVELDQGLQDASDILPLWWSLWLISNFLGQEGFRLSIRAEEIQELTNLNIITQISDALDICLAFVFFENRKQNL